jgi:hypothetical protein
VTERLRFVAMGRRIDKLVPIRVRAAAAMPAAVLTVHQLRYQLAFGARADEKLASQGHQYLGAVGPAVAMLLAIGVGLFLARLARAWRDGQGEGVAAAGREPLVKIWLLTTLSLLVIYCGQELLEGALTTGHPGGLTGVFGQGGLWAIPLSVLLGGLVAVLVRVGEAAVRWVVGRHRSRHRAGRARSFQRPRGFIAVLRGPLADAAAGRAPPGRLSQATA